MAGGLFLVTLSGCDDSTKALMRLSADEAETLRKALVAVSTCSEYGCQPRGSLRDVPDDYEESDVTEVAL